MSDENLFSFSTFVHALAGSLGGVFAMATFYPFETVRSRIQVEDSNKYADKSTFAVIQELIQLEGFATLYRGIRPVLITMSTSNFVYFYGFHGLKTLSPGNASADLLFGFIAGTINVLITNPMWVVNSRLKMKGINNTNTSSEPYTGLLDGIFHILKTEGALKLWSGLTPSLILVTNPAIQFMVYELLKRKLLGTLIHPKDVHSIFYFFLGAIAKTVATVTTYPLQVIQTRLRYGLKENYRLPENAGSAHLFLYILKRHGFKGLFMGLEAKLLQTVLTAALMFLSYEKISQFVFAIMLRNKIK